MTCQTFVIVGKLVMPYFKKIEDAMFKMWSVQISKPATYVGYDEAQDELAKFLANNIPGNDGRQVSL